MQKLDSKVKNDNQRSRLGADKKATAQIYEALASEELSDDMR